MLLNLMSDINTYISFSVNNSNNDFSISKGYENIDWSVTDTGEDHYIKIHLLNNYSIDNLTMNLSTITFDTCNLLVSNDNLNWTTIESSVSNQLLTNFSFDKSYDCAYIKIEFNNVTNVVLDSISINYEDVSIISEYGEFFKKYKKDEMNDFLPSKLFNNDSDIKSIFKSYLEL